MSDQQIFEVVKAVMDLLRRGKINSFTPNMDVFVEVLRHWK